MDLRKEFERLLAGAHEDSLKAAGFSRQGRGFRRDQRACVEHYVFQASQNNVPDRHCRYYLNVGLEFPSLRPAALWAFRRQRGMVSWRGQQRVSLVGMGGQVAWATRADSLVRGLAPHWDLDPQFDRATVQRGMAAAVTACASELPAWARNLRGEVRAAWWLGWLVWPFVRDGRD